jgi:hypothetical protein
MMQSDRPRDGATALEMSTMRDAAAKDLKMHFFMNHVSDCESNRVLQPT